MHGVVLQLVNGDAGTVQSAARPSRVLVARAAEAATPQVPPGQRFLLTLPKPMGMVLGESSDQLGASYAAPAHPRMQHSWQGDNGVCHSQGIHRKRERTHRSRDYRDAFIIPACVSKLLTSRDCYDWQATSVAMVYLHLVSVEHGIEPV